MPEYRLKVIKVPLPYKAPDQQMRFPPLSELYLQLLENTDKVRQQYLDGTWKYDPSSNSRDIIFEDEDQDKHHKHRDEDQDKHHKHRDEDQDKHRDEDQDKHHKHRDEDRDEYDYGEHEKDKENDDDYIDDDDEIGKKLSKILGDSDNEREDDNHHKEKERDDIGDVLRDGSDDEEIGQGRVPKPLSELPTHIDDGRKGGRDLPPIRDFGRTSAQEEDENTQKKELLFKFVILKKSYPTANIPEFSEHSDLANMKSTYESTIRRLSLDANVETYKTYLVGGFMIVEFIGTTWFSLPFDGFTQQQMFAMNKYERLLIELGEKNYISGPSKWPVEVRLIFLIIINAALFLVGKLVLRNAGPSMATVFGQIFGSSQENQGNQYSSQQHDRAPVRRRHMRGPSIRVGELPDPEDEEYEHGKRKRD
jgi:hypothetical protein